MDLQNIPTELLIFGNLCQISNRLEVIGNDFLEDLTIKQWFFLALLSNFISNPPSINDMAYLMGVSHQNIKQIALKLEKKGFINIKTDEKDKRILRLIFSKKAKEYGKSFKEKGSLFLNLLYEDFSEEDKNEFASFSNKILDTLKKMQETKKYKNLGE